MKYFRISLWNSEKGKRVSANFFSKARKFLIRWYPLIPVLLIISIGSLYIVFSIISCVKERAALEEYEKQMANLDVTVFNEYGLEGDKELSEEVLVETGSFYIFSDRIVQKISINSNNLLRFSQTVNSMRRAVPEDVNISVMPIPYRIQYEPVDGEDSNAVFKGFVKDLNRHLTSEIRVIDCSDIIGNHGGRNLFYRTDSDWTVKGAYYGYQGCCSKMGIMPYPENHFNQYQINDFYGDLFFVVDDIEKDKETINKILAWMPNDPFYYRLSEGAKNYETVLSGEDEEYKRPLISFAVAGSDSIVGNIIQYAIIPGKGQGAVILVVDNPGKAMAPYFTENYGTVIVVDVSRYDGEELEDLIASYDVSEILIAQTADNMGIPGYSKFLNRYVE